MNYQHKDKNLAYRCSIRAAIVIFVTVLLSHYFSSAEKFWMPVTAMLVLLAFQRGHVRAALLSTVSVVILLVLCMPFFPENWLYFRALDIMIGGAIGWAASLFILPVRIDDEFRKNTVPLLQACSSYLSVIVTYVFDRSFEKEVLDKKNNLEEIWGDFPSWVFEAGFSANLQQGHRHFLVRLEQIRQILFTLNHLARYNYEEEILLQLETPMKRYVAQITQLFDAISTVLVLQKLAEGVDDISVSFELLEATFKKVIPYSVESLDIGSDYICLAHLIEELRELGNLLIVLAKTLR